MDLLLQGITLGIGLSILVGPILITVLQSSLEYGKWAGLAVGVGIWTSDLLFIQITYFGIAQVKQLTDWSDFELFTGIVGGLILIGFGSGIIFSKVSDPQLNVENTDQPYSPIKQFLKGFAINTFNPFTILFWIGLSTTVVVEAAYSIQEAFLFYGGILGTLIVTDGAKVLLSDWLRQYLSKQRILLFRRLAGGILILFGMVLIFRVVF